MNYHFAVIGDPIKHSLSPAMHNAALKAMKLDGQYSAIHVTEEGLPDFISYARKELDGFNITVPHKKNIIPFLDEISDECRHSESVNTVTIKNGRLIGCSTDGYGLETALKESFELDLSNKTFCFIGCGGAVNAVAFHFAARKAKALYFINRTLTKAEELSERLQAHFPDLEIQYCTPAAANINSLISQSAAIIQATSLGLNPDDPAPINPSLLEQPDICFYDTIYKETALIRHAASNDIKHADGRNMLLHQGAKSLSLWTGLPVPVETMRQALYNEITARRKTT